MILHLDSSNGKELTTRDVEVVHFTGHTTSLDEETAYLVHDQLLALANEPSATDLHFDFDNVDFLSCMALAMLVSLHKKLLTKGRHLAICNLSPQVHEVFAITRLDRFLDLRLTAQRSETVAQDGHVRLLPGVLAVDDETPVLSVLAQRLRTEGYKVWLAGHGHQAINTYQRDRELIDVVLLDVLMPGMDGPQTLTALKKLCPTVQCCFMTGNPMPYTEESLLEMGAVRVFRKPFAFIEVLTTLNQLALRSPWRRLDRWIEVPRKGV
jgi:two-component system OmpR family response regulator